MPNDLLKYDGEARTDMHCTECSKGFIALVDYSLDGNHIIECPHCGHEHCRVIKGGRITEDRWSSRPQQAVDPHRPRRVWKHNSLPAQTSTASEFLRERWLNKLV